MAPEQAEGRRVTGATDVYSLALTLYEAWTGDEPGAGRQPRGHRAPGRALAAAARLTPPRPARRSCARRSTPRSTPTPTTARRPRELREVLRDVAGRAVRRGRPGGARDARALRPDRGARAHQDPHDAPPRARGDLGDQARGAGRARRGWRRARWPASPPGCCCSPGSRASAPSRRSRVAPWR